MIKIEHNIMNKFNLVVNTGSWEGNLGHVPLVLIVKEHKLKFFYKNVFFVTYMVPNII